MNWSNVKLILVREIRDQLRDRRTMFMIFVLPLLLYPLLGMSFFQISQFTREQPTSVLIVGARDLVDLPPLVEHGRFAERLFSDPDRVRLLEVDFARSEPTAGAKELSDDQKRAEARRRVQTGEYDAAVFFAEGFGEQARAYQQAIRQWREVGGRDADGGGAPVLDVKPEIIYSTANEKSQIAFARLFDVLGRWNEQFGETNLAARGLPANVAKPFELATTDVADETGHRGAAIWSKILPILLLLWAMTGAFYPAVDLCAGEKERGTLETLLSSPAERSEIVLGKLLTIMLFSMTTAVLNLVSMGITGWLVLARMPQFGPPPWIAVVWLALALVPVSALFSALCLALAAFARSTKEGQYYLIPLMLVTMPLVILPMAPGVELTLGNSLIPVTGVVLLLRSMLEGSYWQALQFSPPVVAVTLGACLLAIRWAVEQFNSESVLFRESERLDVNLWMRRLMQDRGPTPTVAGAVFCGVVILLIRFFISFAIPAPAGFGDFAVMVLVTQLVVIAMPALLMTVMLTNSPRQTLLLRRPPWLTLAAAPALAVLLHPSVNALQVAVTRLYPLSDEMKETLEGFFQEAPSFWQLALLVAVVPAICEELAFRGFILSGFRHLGHKWRAIIYSALFFGFSHALLQQSLVACVVGVVIGFLAVQTGSILPGMLFHVIHNTLTLADAKIIPQLVDRWPVLGTLMAPAEEGVVFGWPAVAVSGVLAFALLVWFQRLYCPKSEEERRQEAVVRALQTDTW